MCFAFPLADGGVPTAATICGADTLDALTWTSVSACPSAGLVGCCGMQQTWQCFYGSGGTPESTCTSNGGTWSTTSP
jgi:hypothetical protein